MAEINRRDGDAASARYSVLADADCRQVVEFFREADSDVVSLDVLAEELRTPARSSTDPTGLAVQLHHVTLPKLSEAGVLEYDSDEKRVRYSGDGDLESILEDIRTVESEFE